MIWHSALPVKSVQILIWVLSLADIWEDQIYGYQGASAFKLDATSYSYESYVLNDCETVEDLMKWVCSFADVLLDWLDEDLAMFGLTPEDFGFNL